MTGSRSLGRLVASALAVGASGRALQVEGVYEWAGVFELEHEDHTWIAQKVGGDYADASMKYVALATTSGDEAGIEAVEGAGEAALGGDCADLASGGTIEVGTCYTLVFDASADTSTWTIAAEHGFVAMFTEHVPVEFERDTHYLQDASGGDVEPLAEEGSDGHDHGGHAAYEGAYEWVGVFELEHGETYAWTSQKVDGDYADGSMDLVVLEVSGDTEEAVHAVETAAEKLINGTTAACAEVSPGVTLGEGTCYTLVFDDAVYSSLWEIAVPARRRQLGDGHGHSHGDGDYGYFAFFAQHVPTEFELDSHYLKDETGEDVEPLYEWDAFSSESSSSSSNRRGYAWRHSMIATAVVLACTFVGLLGRIPFRNAAALRSDDVLPFASALGVGALLGCAVFLMFVESTHLIAARWAEETQATWRFGVMVLAGYVSGLIGNICFPRATAADAKKGARADEPESAEPINEKGVVGLDAVAVTEVEPDYAFCFNIFMGDFLHNFVDGIFIANAFLDCASGRGWVVTAATIYHELVQEFGDFFLLIGPGGLGVIASCFVNLMSGTSVMIGAAVYLATKPGNGTQGLMLAYSGGVYTYVACTEAAEHMLNGAGRFSPAKRFGLLVAFALGAVGIGLVLLDHVHCTPKDSDGDSGGGHAH